MMTKLTMEYLDSIMTKAAQAVTMIVAQERAERAERRAEQAAEAFAVKPANGTSKYTD